MVEKIAHGNFGFKVTAASYDLTEDGVANYVLHVVGPKDISFTLKDRYSSIREFQSIVKKYISKADVTPTFPNKKYFGNKSHNFCSNEHNSFPSFYRRSWLSH